MVNLIRNWNNENKPNLFRRLERVQPLPLKERIAHALYRLKTIEAQLEAASNRMQKNDKDLFEKCVAAELEKDVSRAAIYANECAEVRKLARVLLSTKLAIEQVMLRLETVEEFGDIAVQMAPIASVVRALKGKIAGVVPEVSMELGEIGDMVSGVVSEVGDANRTTYDVGVSNSEAQRILMEANSIVDQRMRDQFPDLPTSIKTPSAHHVDIQSER